MRWPHRTGVAVISAACLLFSDSPARADDNPPDGNSSDGKVWELSSLLKGTTAHIRDQVNGQLEEKLTTKAARQEQYKQLQANEDQKMTAVAASLRTTSPEFAKADADLPAARSALEAAHKQGNGSDAIDAQARIDADQAVVRKSLDTAAAADPDVSKVRKEMSDLQADILHMTPAISNAAKARDQLIDGIREPYQLHGNASDQSVRGIIGRVKVQGVVDAHSFTADYPLFTAAGVDKTARTPDGMVAKTGSTRIVHVLVTGVDTAHMRAGLETTLDQYFQFGGQKVLDDRTCYLLNRVDPAGDEQDVEQLFKALDTVHVPPGVKFK
jgi:hypothetical protein